MVKPKTDPNLIAALVAAWKTKPLPADGHSLYAQDFYRDYPPGFVAAYTKVHKSNMRSPKSIIFDNDGNPIRELRGVYNLDMLRGIAATIGADTRGKWHSDGVMGRGFRAVALVKAINDCIDAIYANGEADFVDGKRGPQ